MDQNVLQIIYLSKGTRSFDFLELQEMSYQFAEKNSMHDITGLLIRIGNYFVQILEGGEAVVESLVSRIEKDPRHAGFTVLARNEDVERVFGQWSMNFIDLNSTYYVNLQETALLRDQIEDITGMPSSNRKQIFMNLIRRIAEHIRAAKPRGT